MTRRGREVVRHVRGIPRNRDLHRQAHRHRGTPVDAPAAAEHVQLAGDFLSVITEEQRRLHARDVRSRNRSEVAGVVVGAGNRGEERAREPAARRRAATRPRTPRADRRHTTRARARAVAGRPARRSCVRGGARPTPGGPDRKIETRHGVLVGDDDESRKAAVERDDRGRSNPSCQVHRYTAVCTWSRPAKRRPSAAIVAISRPTHASHSACLPGNTHATARYEPRAGSPNSRPDGGRSCLHAARRDEPRPREHTRAGLDRRGKVVAFVPAIERDGLAGMRLDVRHDRRPDLDIRPPAARAPFAARRTPASRRSLS